jgi:hypothetical protein
MQQLNARINCDGHWGASMDFLLAALKKVGIFILAMILHLGRRLTITIIVGVVILALGGLFNTASEPSEVENNIAILQEHFTLDSAESKVIFLEDEDVYYVRLTLNDSEFASSKVAASDDVEAYNYWIEAINAVAVDSKNLHDKYGIDVAIVVVDSDSFSEYGESFEGVYIFVENGSVIHTFLDDIVDVQS